jgi:hypothetical protein
MAHYLEWRFPRYTQRVIWFHVPNQRMGRLTRVILSYLGVLPGVADLVIIDCHLRVAGFVEVKTAKGSLSKTQRAFRDWVLEAGHQYAVCRSLDDLIAALDDWDMSGD